MSRSGYLAQLVGQLAPLRRVQGGQLIEQHRGSLLGVVSETFAEVPDGKTTSHVLGVLAHLLDSAGPG